jgi:hypothetical protein
METDTIQKNGAREKILINNYILPNTTGLQPVRLICLTRTASPIGGVVDDWWDDF